jgi:hypothetical protein
MCRVLVLWSGPSREGVPVHVSGDPCGHREVCVVVFLLIAISTMVTEERKVRW